MTETLVVGNLPFTLRRSARRTTVGITIDRDGELILSAPADAPLDLIERVAGDKLLWIHTRLAERELIARPVRERELVSGEGFYFLGRSYRLLLIAPPSDTGAVPPLRLHQGRFFLRRDEQARGQEHFVRWYVEHGQPWLQHRVDLFADRIGVAPGPVEVRDLGYRWASCSRSGALNFHWRTVLLPPRIVEYVVVHELVHLAEPNHGREFWRCLERAMPDFAERKQWLAEHGGRYS